jgi:hypothetical protein
MNKSHPLWSFSHFESGKTIPHSELAQVLIFYANPEEIKYKKTYNGVSKIQKQIFTRSGRRIRRPNKFSECIFTKGSGSVYRKKFDGTDMDY